MRVLKLAKLNYRSYDNSMEIGYALVGDRLYCVVYTQRGETMHIISLRKANCREVKRYVDET